MRLPAAVVVVLHALASPVRPIDVDPAGYVLYCPCMGRFGNQADHLLGVLRFAHELNRTLVLPAWVEYDYGRPTARMVPFDTYLQVAPMRRYHRVVLMEHFMEHIAPTVWPVGSRTVFCWTPTASIYGGASPPGCHAKEGNPFGPFWQHYGVDFDRDMYFARDTGGHHVDDHRVRQRWVNTYPPSRHAVLAFRGAPAAFPVSVDNAALHGYLRWSDGVRRVARRFIDEHLDGDGNYVGVHLRNDVDWENVCSHIGDSASRHIFASVHCLGEHFERGPLTAAVCAPSRRDVIRHVLAAVRSHGVRKVFVSADRHHMIDALNEALARLNATAVRRQPDTPHANLAILARSRLYIANCVSTFSAFAARERMYAGDGPKPTEYWGVPAGGVDAASHSEL